MKQFTPEEIVEFFKKRPYLYEDIGYKTLDAALEVMDMKVINTWLNGYQCGACETCNAADVIKEMEDSIKENT